MSNEAKEKACLELVTWLNENVLALKNLKDCVSIRKTLMSQQPNISKKVKEARANVSTKEKDIYNDIVSAVVKVNTAGVFLNNGKKSDIYDLVNRGLPNNLLDLSKKLGNSELKKQVSYFGQRLLLAKKNWNKTYNEYQKALGWGKIGEDKIVRYVDDWENIEAVSSGQEPQNKQTLGPAYGKDNESRQGG